MARTLGVELAGFVDRPIHDGVQKRPFNNPVGYKNLFADGPYNKARESKRAAGPRIKRAVGKQELMILRAVADAVERERDGVERAREGEKVTNGGRDAYGGGRMEDLFF